MSIKHLLVGPTKEEVANYFSGASAKAKHQALITVSKEGNLEIVQLLIEHGVNIHEKKDEAMREAAYHGQLEVIKLLVANDGDIHIKNEEALAFAVSCHTNNGHSEVINYLLENGAVIEISKKNHPTEWSNIRDAGIQGYLDNL